MCDFSLHSVKSRPAKVGDKLTTLGWRDQVIEHKTAIFRHINKDKVAVYQFALD